MCGHNRSRHLIVAKSNQIQNGLNRASDVSNAPEHSSPSKIASSVPPLLTSPVVHNTLPSSEIAIAQQGRNINIQRRIRLRVRQQLLDSSQGTR
jgi:hypothetical protein